MPCVRNPPLRDLALGPLQYGFGLAELRTAQLRAIRSTYCNQLQVFDAKLAVNPIIIGFPMQRVSLLNFNAFLLDKGMNRNRPTLRPIVAQGDGILWVGLGKEVKC